jgi:hypothetical protein
LEWKDCIGTDRSFYKGNPAVVQYPAGTADSVRTPERVITGPNTLLCQPSAIAVGPGGEVYVLNHARGNPSKPPAPRPGWTTWVTVYDSAANGDAAPSRALEIGSLSGGGASTIAVDRAGFLYVAYTVHGPLDAGSVTVFEPGVDGNVEPVRVLSGPRTGLQRPKELALDRQGNLYALNVKGDLDDTVRVFSAVSAGNVEPYRVIAGAHTGLARPIGLAVDQEERLYVANAGHRVRPNSVTVYDAGATGDTAPIRIITATQIADGMERPRRVAIGTRDSLYVRSERNLSVFGAEAGDTLRLSRTFYQHAPDLFALDRHDTLYTLVADTVMVYPSGYSGGRPAIRKLAGPSTGVRGTTDMAVDSRGWLYLAVDSAIRVFAPGASGDVAPSRTIAGSRTRLSKAYGIALDHEDRLYVSNGPLGGGGPEIRIYAPTARGTDPPVRMLKGPSTSLEAAGEIEFDSRGYMYVPSPSTTVNVFRPDASGDEAPVRTLTGPETLLRNATALAFGPGDTLYALNAFGYTPNRRCGGLLFGGGSPNAAVTVYAPGASGEVEPVRNVVLIKNAQTRVRVKWWTLFWPRGLAVDSSGALQVWNSVGSVLYAPGANGFVAPVRTFAEPREDGADAGAVTVSRDGRIYELNVPHFQPVFC